MSREQAMRQPTDPFSGFPKDKPAPAVNRPAGKLRQCVPPLVDGDRYPQTWGAVVIYVRPAGRCIKYLAMQTKWGPSFGEFHVYGCSTGRLDPSDKGALWCTAEDSDGKPIANLKQHPGPIADAVEDTRQLVRVTRASGGIYIGEGAVRKTQIDRDRGTLTAEGLLRVRCPKCGTTVLARNDDPNPCPACKRSQEADG